MKNIYAYYINVFKNRKGNIVGSEDGIMNTEGKAILDAVEYVLDFGWEYIETLSNHSFPVDLTSYIEAEKENRIQEKLDNAKYGSYEDQVFKHHNSLIRG